MATRDPKVAVVTGAARGLGAGVADALARAGYRVALTGLEGDLLAANAARIGPGAAAFEADVTDPAAVRGVFDAARSRFGRIDAVVSNAGVSNFSLLANMPVESFRQVLRVNLEGAFHVVQASLPHLRDSRGYLLSVASIAAASAPPGMAAYGASKSALESMTDTLRSEVSHLGIDVGVAYFGWLDTDLVRLGETHPAFSLLRKNLPGPLSAVNRPEMAIRALVNGVRRRKRRVFAPPWIGAAMAMRWFVAADTSTYERLMPEVERLFDEQPQMGGGDPETFVSTRQSPRTAPQQQG